MSESKSRKESVRCAHDGLADRDGAANGAAAARQLLFTYAPLFATDERYQRYMADMRDAGIVISADMAAEAMHKFQHVKFRAEKAGGVHNPYKKKTMYEQLSGGDGEASKAPKKSTSTASGSTGSARGRPRGTSNQPGHNAGGQRRGRYDVHTHLLSCSISPWTQRGRRGHFRPSLI